MEYTRNNLDNGEAQSTADRILLRLKTKGAASTATLAQELDITVEAARLQMQKLFSGHLVAGLQEASTGVGRPRQKWVLTATGHARFPDTHAQLTVDLIGSVRQLFGESGLDKLISQREDTLRVTYFRACEGLMEIADRVEKLASLREAEGYMARIERDGADWLLIEDHCPICAAARTCQGFCRSELQLFQEVVGGDAQVSREEHLFAGARRCVYRIRAIVL